MSQHLHSATIRNRAPTLTATLFLLIHAACGPATERPSLVNHDSAAPHVKARSTARIDADWGRALFLHRQAQAAAVIYTIFTGQLPQTWEDIAALGLIPHVPLAESPPPFMTEASVRIEEGVLQVWLLPHGNEAEPLLFSEQSLAGDIQTSANDWRTMASQPGARALDPNQDPLMQWRIRKLNGDIMELLRRYWEVHAALPPDWDTLLAELGVEPAGYSTQPSDSEAVIRIEILPEQGWLKNQSRLGTLRFIEDWYQPTAEPETVGFEVMPRTNALRGYAELGSPPWTLLLEAWLLPPE